MFSSTRLCLFTMRLHAALRMKQSKLHHLMVCGLSVKGTGRHLPLLGSGLFHAVSQLAREVQFIILVSD